MRNRVSRRKFIKDTSVIIIGSLSALSLPFNLLAQGSKDTTKTPPPKVKVVEVISPNVWPEGKPEPVPEIIKEFFKAGLKEITGQSDLKTVWQSLVTPEDVVGIKVNAMGAMGKMNCCTRPAVVAEVVEGLKLAGVDENNIIIWDKMNTLLTGAGFKINTSKKGVRCFGTVDDGFDDKVTYSAKTDPPGKSSKYCTILTKQITKLINIPILKNNTVKGITGALVNVTLGGLDQVSRFHQFNCDPMIAEIYSHPAIKDKTILHIMDALEGCFTGGPMPNNPKDLWRRNSLLFSRDPVALDRIHLDIIDKKRQEEKLPSLQPASKHIFTAEKMGLGVADLGQINHLQINLNE